MFDSVCLEFRVWGLRSLKNNEFWKTRVTRKSIVALDWKFERRLKNNGDVKGNIKGGMKDKWDWKVEGLSWIWRIWIGIWGQVDDGSGSVLSFFLLLKSYVDESCNFLSHLWFLCLIYQSSFSFEDSSGSGILNYSKFESWQISDSQCWKDEVKRFDFEILFYSRMF